jgi:hypothetical protein
MTMPNDSAKLPEPLRTVISTCFDIELFWHSFPSGVHEYLAGDAAKAQLFKEQFAEAILNSTMTVDQYRRLTGKALASDRELSRWLRQLWGEIYGEEPIPGDDD